jgi:hypothetical protein
MTSLAEYAKELEHDTISSENLIVCLEAQNYRVVTMAMFKAIERNYCNQRIVDRLCELSTLLKDNKFIGPWQMGHVALATLSLIKDEGANEKYNELFKNLSENDKFLVGNFIQSESYKV